MIHRAPGQSMLRYVKPAMRTGFALVVAASAMLAVPAARASIDPTMPPDPATSLPVLVSHRSPHTVYTAQRVHPAAAPVSSTRQVAHGLSAHHRRHTARLHRVETSLRTHVVAASSLPAPARKPAHPPLPRTGHRAPDLTLRHRDTGSRTHGGAGLPFAATGTLSLAVLGACVHQRTRDRLRSISERLESRGPPRAGPLHATASRSERGALDDIPPSASALNHPPGWSPDTRALTHPQSFRIARTDHALAGVYPPPPAVSSRCPALPALARPFHARASRSTPQWTGALRPTRSARARASAPRHPIPRSGGFPMKRAHALILTVAAMAFTASLALATTPRPPRLRRRRRRRRRRTTRLLRTRLLLTPRRTSTRLPRKT